MVRLSTINLRKCLPKPNIQTNRTSTPLVLFSGSWHTGAWKEDTSALFQNTRNCYSISKCWLPQVSNLFGCQVEFCFFFFFFFFCVCRWEEYQTNNSSNSTRLRNINQDLLGCCSTKQANLSSNCWSTCYSSKRLREKSENLGQSQRRPLNWKNTLTPLK